MIRSDKISMSPAMKFWQLISGFRSEPEVLNGVFSDPQWSEFSYWHAEFSSLVRRQNRAILDAVVPDSLVLAVASRSAQQFLLTSDGILRADRPSTAGETLSAVEVVQRYGGAVIEDVHEYGSVQVCEG